MNQKIINPSKLFPPRILNFKVETNKLGAINYVNLDNAATTPPLAEVEKSVSDYMTSYGSVHRGAGTKSKVSTDIYEESRRTIKSFLNAPKDSYVIYTSNTTGAINALAYYFSFLKGKIAVSALEHSSSWLPWVKTEGITTCPSQQVELDKMENLNVQIQQYGHSQVIQYNFNQDYEFDLAYIEEILKNNHVKALVLTASSNVTGYCPDIQKIGQLVHKHGALFVVDACQFLQHHPMDMQKYGVDFLVASGHKFYAPYGGGFLIGPKKFFDHFLPHQIGGGNLPYIASTKEFLHYRNQLTHDPGTPNALGAISMASALGKLDEIGLSNIEKHESKMVKKVFTELSKNKKVKFFVSEKYLSSVLPFIIEGQDPFETAEILNQDYGIGIRAGSFCTYNLLRHFLNISDDSNIVTKVKSGDKSCIPAIARASFGLCNTMKDADRFIQAINEITN